MSNIVYLNNQLPIITTSLLSILILNFFILNRDSNANYNKGLDSLVIKDVTPPGLINEILFARVTLILFCSYYLFVDIMKFTSSLIMFDQLTISSFSYSMIIISTMVYICMQLITYIMFIYKITLPLEYLFGLSLFYTLSPLLYASTSFYSFFFLIEVLSIIIMLLFSAITYTGVTPNSNNISVLKPMPSKLVCSLFLQF